MLAAKRIRRSTKATCSAVSAVLAVCLPVQAVGQALPTECDRVRITRTDGAVITGIFMDATEEGIRLRPNLGQQAPFISVDDVRLMEGFLGRQGKFWKYFGISVGTSIVAMTTAVALSWERCTNFCSSFDASRTSAAVFYGTVLGAFIGVPIGTLVGSTLKREQWEPLVVPTSGTMALSIQPVVGVRLGLSASLRLPRGW